ncbi:MAG: glutamine amidotransferase [Cyanobacteria bacterium HKST-UBA06]|nr:glutamine amidotransferase [Cyanobacteria bacterium HKST-UBA05]MCA9808390.1 glutamine amidotransferase [Cyanobacteria bacterium HKST-UBA06]
MKLVIAHLYPAHLNMYGDRGNVLAMVHRARCRGIEAEVVPVGPGDALVPEAVDFVFMGGGQDAQQMLVSDDLARHKADAMRQAAERGVVMLGICGGYQMLGHYYQPYDSDPIPGLGLLDCTTVAGPERFIGNVVVVRPDGSTLVGFENHSGLTTLGHGVVPLGTVKLGKGNNGQDGSEGAVSASGTLYGTYLHGSLLPKNPSLTDELLGKALSVRYGEAGQAAMQQPVSPALQALETSAHQRALALHR